jgi:hypothetical protein
MFRYMQPANKAQAVEIAQAFMVYLLETHKAPSTAPEPRVVFAPRRPSWPARVIMRARKWCLPSTNRSPARKWRLPAINEPVIVLSTLMVASTGAVFA